MKALSPIARFLALLPVLWIPLLHADEATKPDDTQLRAAIVRGLDFLSREGDTLMNEKDCNGLQTTFGIRSKAFLGGPVR